MRNSYSCSNSFELVFLNKKNIQKRQYWSPVTQPLLEKKMAITEMTLQEIDAVSGAGTKVGAAMTLLT